MARTRTIAEIDAEMAKLAAKRKQIAAREKERERKQRNHALMLYGGMLEEVCGGDWRAIDPDEARAYFTQYAGAIRKRLEKDPGRSSDEANEAVRAFERELREQKAAARAEKAELVAKALEPIAHTAQADDAGDAEDGEPEWTLDFGWDDEED